MIHLSYASPVLRGGLSVEQRARVLAVLAEEIRNLIAIEGTTTG